MIIAVDFDGTVVSHEYPFIGKDIGAVPVLKALVDNGHRIILNTMRDYTPKSFKKGDKVFTINTLKEAVNWFKENKIPLSGINKNHEQSNWTNSPKIFAHIYIDDSSLGVPLIFKGVRPYVNWIEIAQLLKNKNLITKEQFKELTKNESF